MNRHPIKNNTLKKKETNNISKNAVDFRRRNYTTRN